MSDRLAAYVELIASLRESAASMRAGSYDELEDWAARWGRLSQDLNDIRPPTDQARRLMEETLHLLAENETLLRGYMEALEQEAEGVRNGRLFLQRIRPKADGPQIISWRG